MARIRSVKPELCTSETMALVSAEAERTFIRLWTHCDDEGRCKDHPKLLKAQLFPLHDDVTPDDVDRHLVELESHGLIVRYSVAGERFLSVPSWSEHQKPQKKQASKLPSVDLRDDLPEQDESRTATRPVQERYGPVVEGRVGEREVVVVEGDVATSISEQPQVLETAPSPAELEQSVNRAVGMVARLRAVNGDNPEALAAHIGRNFPAEDRAELVELIAAGTDVADAAAAVADPLRGFTTSTHGRAVVGFDPDEAEAIRQQARDREQATQDRLRAMAETPAVDPLAAVRDLRAARKAATA